MHIFIPELRHSKFGAIVALHDYLTACSWVLSLQMLLLEGNIGSGGVSAKRENELPCSGKQEVPADTRVYKVLPTAKSRQ